MRLKFCKYQGTGNDFVIVDNRKGEISLTRDQVAFLCHRRFGIGADGLMLLNSHADYHFEMKYYNADGAEGTMCGNGGRCLVKFADEVGIRQPLYRFLAIDGEHEARINNNGEVALKMMNVPEMQAFADHYVLNTGSPHYVLPTKDVNALDVFTQGRFIRYSKNYAAEGINVNFIEPLQEADRIRVRTYERGVEDETYSCGTGVTAAALVHHHRTDGQRLITVETKGGILQVSFEKTAGGYQNIWLIGPAVRVFKGEIEM